jgi:cyclin-like protein
MSSPATSSEHQIINPMTVFRHADFGSPGSPLSRDLRNRDNTQSRNFPAVGMRAPNPMEAFNVPPIMALKMFCAHLGNLVKSTGDVPSTPLMSTKSSLNGREDNAMILVGNENGQPKVADSPCVQGKDGNNGLLTPHAVQNAVLAKRFYSKKAPPIALEEYMLRLHKYCPMSTAVYLAASVYITRMAVVEKIILVTPRNVHRLVLAGLRVAMKALEDLSYPHNRFAKVGGVSERELTRLEITFCFLVDFDLRVDAQLLKSEVESLQRSSTMPHDAIDLNFDLLQLKDKHCG